MGQKTQRSPTLLSYQGIPLLRSRTHLERHDTSLPLIDSGLILGRREARRSEERRKFVMLSAAVSGAILLRFTSLLSVIPYNTTSLRVRVCSLLWSVDQPSRRASINKDRSRLQRDSNFYTLALLDEPLIHYSHAGSFMHGPLYSQ
jgi:hypothetical protein